MPYYEKINTLFIHIPKTGGSSVELFLKQKSPQTLYTSRINTVLPESQYHNKSLQHQTYSVIYKYRELLKVKFDASLNVITIVRNPYNRIMSDLFYHKLIKPKDSQEAVFTAIKWFLKCDDYDNHNLPQHKFITDANGNIIDNIHIFKTETLTKDLKAYGYADYGGAEKCPEYYEYLNREALNLINEIYTRDFDLFGYKRR